MTKLRDFLTTHTDILIRRRGFFYFTQGNVISFKFSYDRVAAIVKGSDDYFVKIDFNSRRKNPQAYICTCPFSKPICKHIVAVLYKVNSTGYFNNNFYPYKFSEGENLDDIFGDDFFSKDFLNNIYSEDYDSGENLFSSNQVSLKEHFMVLKERWLEDIKKKKEKISLERFREKVEHLIQPVEKKKKNQPYKLAYAISINGDETVFYLVKERVNKEGETTSAAVWHNPDLALLPDLSFEEKMIIRNINRSYNLSINFKNYYLKDAEQSQVFSDILSFFAGRRIYNYASRYSLIKKMEILKEEGHAVLLIDDKDDSLILKIKYFINDKEIENNIQLVVDKPLWLYAEDKIFKVKNLSYEQYSTFSENDGQIEIPKSYIEYFEEQYLSGIAKNLPIISEKYKIEIISLPPVKRAYLSESEESLEIRLKFLYGEYELPYSKDEAETSALNNKVILKIIRDRISEDNARSELKTFYVKEIKEGVFVTRRNPVDFLFAAIPALKEMGFEIFGDADLKKYKVNTAKPVFSVSVSSGIDWFDVEADIQFSGIPVSIHDLMNAVRHKKNYIQLSDGSVGLLPEEWAKKFMRAFSFSEEVEGKLRFSRPQANALDLLIKEADNAEADEKFKEHIEKLNSFEKIAKQKIPAGFKGTLRGYQKAGFDWFYFLKEYSFGGILADDMGLGKTIQVLTLLQKEKKKKRLTSIVIAPTSVVFNWINEAEKFTPGLKVLNHVGTERNKESCEHFEDYDLILTSYGILLRDAEIFLKFKFHYIILDESQKIKNPLSKSGRAARALNGNNRLCLTGTPVENNLNELWSQMSFVNPGFLGSLNKFNEAFVKPVQRQDESALIYLKKLLYPFILRRTKDIVAKELPPKTEIIHYCEMEPEQEKIYNIWRDSIRSEIIKEIAEKGIKRSGFKVLEGLLRLRQICNHPVLVKENYKKKSGKLEEFKEQVGKVIDEGHKVLVFSQFVKMLNIIRSHLDAKEIKYEYLIGSTKDREKCVNNFQNNAATKVFLISLKAGGFGLNLTAADYVFHYDPWWNPAVEMQATDRTHRIGQDKKIFVYKFITKSSVEEKILQLQQKKKELVSSIITSETGILKNISREDIEVLFG